MAIAITLEPELASVPASQFRLLINGRVVATGLTVSEAHYAVSEVLLRIAYPESAGEQGRALHAGKISRDRPRLPRASTLRLTPAAA
jgi:hypothetical protein